MSPENHLADPTKRAKEEERLGAEVQKVQDEIGKVDGKYGEVDYEKTNYETERVEVEGFLAGTDDPDEEKMYRKKIDWLDIKIEKAEAELAKLSDKKDDLVSEEATKQAALDLYRDPADEILQLTADRDAADVSVDMAKADLSTTEGNLSTAESELATLKEAEATASDEFKVWKKQSPEERVYTAARDDRNSKESALEDAEGVTQEKQTEYNTAAGDVAAAETALSDAEEALESVLNNFICCDLDSGK